LEDLSGLHLTILTMVSFLLSLLFALMKSALIHLSPARFEEIQQNEKAKKEFQTFFLPKLTAITITITLLNTLCNIIFVASIILFFSDKGHITTINLIWGIGFSLIPLIIVAKAIPESLGRARAEQIMLHFLFFTKLIYWLFWWIVFPLYYLISTLDKMFEPLPTSFTAAAIEKEILQVVSEGEKEGIFQETEKNMIQGIIQLKDSEVKEIMTPRTDMMSISINESLDKILQLAIESGHSRIPLYQENRDDIIGTLYVKDLLKYWNDPDKNNISVQQLMRKPYFVPETKHIGALLRDLQKQKLHMAIVLDEYGGTAGIITVEDILEEIVGEILDEYDLEISEPIRRINDHELEVDGRLHVDELNRTLNIDIPLDAGYDTISGFLFASMGYIPDKGESYRYENIEFIIQEATSRKIDRLKVKILS
jgi:CBS domain containing-hemolysin-like protein